MRRLQALSVVLALVAGCEVAESPLPLVGTLERDRIEVPAQAWETLVEIRVREGQAVKPGQVLVRQEPALVTAQAEQARAAERRVTRRLAELERGPRTEDISAARARLEGAESQLHADEKAFRRTQQLVDRALLSESDLDAARARLEVSIATRDEVSARLAELVAGTTDEELDQARADLEEARARLAERSLDLERLEIRAPVAGVVDSIPYKPGDRPLPGATIMVLLAGNAPYARVYVPEPIRAQVTPGMSALVQVDGVSEPVAGRVRTVSSDPVFTPYFALTERDRSRLAYVAEVTLVGKAADALPAGLPVEVSFPDLPDSPAR
jgi:HlyD family secretion protein